LSAPGTVTLQCGYVSCPVGSITATQALCESVHTSSSECTFPSLTNPNQWPQNCPCIQ
jgi:hypothetical protein